MKRCRFCGMKSAPSLRQIGNRYEFECKSETRCFNRVLADRQYLRDLLKRVRFIGSQMANACSNLSQEARAPGLHPEDRKTLGELGRQWDELAREGRRIVA